MHDDCSEIAFLGLESEAAYPKSDLTLTFLDLLWRHVEHAERSDVDRRRMRAGEYGFSPEASACRYDATVGLCFVCFLQTGFLREGLPCTSREFHAFPP